MLRSLLFCASLLPGSALAQERQFRAVDLTDGRTIRAEILATEAEGLRVRTPQGEALIPFEFMVNITAIDEAAYMSQEPMRIWVHSPDWVEPLTTLYSRIPHVLVSNENEPNGLPPGVVVQLGRCGADFTCMAEAVDPDTPMWLVTALPPAGDSQAAVVLRARFSSGPPIHREDITIVDPNTLWERGHVVIGLIPPGKPPKSVREAFTGMAETRAGSQPRPDRSTPVAKARRNAVLYGLGGAVMGASFFALAATCVVDDSPNADSDLCEKSNAIGTGVVLTVAGGVIGSIFGYASTPAAPVQIGFGGRW